MLQYLHFLLNVLEKKSVLYFDIMELYQWCRSGWNFVGSMGRSGRLGWGKRSYFKWRVMVNSYQYFCTFLRQKMWNCHLKW